MQYASFVLRALDYTDFKWNEAIFKGVSVGLFTAEEVGASHKRERLFILAYRESVFGQHTMPERDSQGRPTQAAGSFGHHMGNAEHDGSSAAAFTRGDGTDAGARGSAGGTDTSQQSARTDYVADTQGAGKRGKSGQLPQTQWGQDGSLLRLSDSASKGLADCDHAGCEEQCGAEPIQAQHEAAECRGLPALPIFAPGPEGDWSCAPEGLEPAICRMVDGLAYRVDRIRACGNGVVPLAAAYAWRTLISRAKATTHGETD